MKLEKHIDQARAFLNELATGIGTENNPHKTSRILASSFAGLRNVLTVEESFDMIAQLPVFIKGMYIDKWHVSGHHEKIKNVDQLLDVILQFEGDVALKDFGSREDAKLIVQTVFAVLKRHISAAESSDIEAVLGRKLGEFWHKA